MRILQVSPAFEPHIGGVEAAVRETARRLSDRGHSVEVLTADETHALPPRERIKGTEVRRVRAWPKGGDQRLAPGIMREIEGRGYDVVHIQCYQTLVAPLAMLAAARAGVPYVVTFHGGGHSSRSRNAFRGTQLRILRPLLARARALIATARWEVPHYSKILRLPAERFVHIPNGCDLPSVDSPATRRATTIVSIGRAERYKGHQFAIDAMPEVVDAIPDAQLWIAGEGPYVADLKERATSAGIAECVDVHVVPDRSDYAAQLAACSLAVLFSEFETHPIAVIEAAALGVPLLVALKPGLSELVDDGIAHGIRLDAAPTIHAKAMIELLRDPPPAPKVPALSWNDSVDRLEALYSGAVRTGTQSTNSAVSI